VTVKDLAARFDAEHIAVHLKPRRRRVPAELKVHPPLRQPPIADEPRGGRRFHHKYRHVLPGQPLPGDLSKMFNLAELWGMGGRLNPRKHIKKYRGEA
jgi:hypothetical protein